jgi:hypothetical protein
MVIVNDELGRLEGSDIMWLRSYSSICLERLRKTTKKSQQASLMVEN